MIEETAKEAIIRKALNRGTQTLAQVAKENNIALGTLGHWLNKRRSSTKSRDKTVGGLIESGERYKHLKATFGGDHPKPGGLFSVLSKEVRVI